MRDWFLHLADPLFGWLLVLPPTAAICLLGIASATAMVLLRRWTTDQAHLARCAADRKRLKQLRRDARRRGDKPAARRHKAVSTLIQLKQLKAEGWPLLAGILPIALMGTWSFYRLEYHPPRADEPVSVELSLPANAEGSLVSLVPQKGLAADAWICRAEPGAGEPAHAIARWHVQADASEQPYRLAMRYRNETYTHPLLVGQGVYAPPIQQHHDQLLLPQSLVRLRPVQPLGFVPWFGPDTAIGAFLPGWLITYVLVVIPFVYLIKFLLRIH
jgi:hypothetical protein